MTDQPPPFPNQPPPLPRADPVGSAPPVFPVGVPVAAPGPDGLAIASLVLGILGLPLVCCTACVAIPVSLTGLVLGIISKSRDGVRTAGIVVCSAAIALSLVWSVLSMLIGMASAMSK